MAVLLLLGVAAAALAPVLLRRPDWAVGLSAFLLLLHANLVLSQRFGIGLADPLLFGMMVTLVAAYPLLHGDRQEGMTRLTVAYALWFAAAANSLYWSETAGTSSDMLRAYLPNIAYSVALFLLVTDRQRLVAALAGVLAATVLLAVLTTVQLLAGLEAFDFYGLANGTLGHIAEEVDSFRPTGPVLDPNYYAQILMPGFGIAFAAVAGLRGRGRKLLAGLAAGIIGLAILFTASRGGMLAAGATVLYVLYRFRRIGYLALFVPPVLIALSLVPAYATRFMTFATALAALLSGEPVRELSVAGRLSEMEAAAILFVEHPVSGVGYGMFESRYQEISANYDLQLRAADRAAHSLFLEAAAEQGVVGLAALLFLIGSALLALHRGRMMAEAAGDTAFARCLIALGAGAVGLFAASVFLHDAYAQHLWLLLALLFASERAAANEIQQSKTRVGKMYGKQDDPSGIGRGASGGTGGGLAVWSLLEPVRRAALPIGILTAAAIGVAGYRVATESPVYPVRTELLVRIGYEYTPVSPGDAGDYQQVTFRADEVIGTEIQLLSGVANVERALAVAPHPEAGDGTGGAEAIQAVQRTLSAKRIEGSNVILVEVSDPDPVWARAFVVALVDGYRAERERLFGQDSFVAALDRREGEATAALAALDREALETGTEVGAAALDLGDAAQAISVQDVPVAVRVSFAAGLLGLRLLLDRTEGSAGLRDQLDRLTEGDAIDLSGVGMMGGYAALPRVPTVDELSALFGAISEGVSRLEAIASQQEELRRELAELRASRMKQDLRDGASRNVVVMTPPHQLATPNGLALAVKPLFAGFVVFVLASLFFVFMAGYRQARGYRRREGGAHG